MRKVLLYLFNSKCDCKSSISLVHQIEHPSSETPSIAMPTWCISDANLGVNKLVKFQKLFIYNVLICFFNKRVEKKVFFEILS